MDASGFESPLRTCSARGLGSPARQSGHHVAQLVHQRDGLGRSRNGPAGRADEADCAHLTGNHRQCEWRSAHPAREEVILPVRWRSANHADMPRMPPMCASASSPPSDTFMTQERPIPWPVLMGYFEFTPKMPETSPLRVALFRRSVAISRTAMM